jgi:hypothetical protein
MSDPALIRDPIIEAAAQIKAALEEIDSLIGMIECTDKHNLSLLPLFLAEQKRALAALARMEPPGACAVTPLILAKERKEISEQARRYAGYYLEGSDGYNSFTILAEWIEARARMEQP